MDYYADVRGAATTLVNTAKARIRENTTSSNSSLRHLFTNMYDVGIEDWPIGLATEMLAEACQSKNSVAWSLLRPFFEQDYDERVITRAHLEKVFRAACSTEVDWFYGTSMFTSWTNEDSQHALMCALDAKSVLGAKAVLRLARRHDDYRWVSFMDELMHTSTVWVLAMRAGEEMLKALQDSWPMHSSKPVQDAFSEWRVSSANNDPENHDAQVETFVKQFCSQCA